MRFLRWLLGRKPVPATDVLGLHLNEDNILDATFRFVAVDVETASADTSSICQLGLALVNDKGSVHTLSFLIDPELPFDASNTVLHGISARKVKGSPTFPAVFTALRPFLERHALIQHSSFDRKAIFGACARYKLSPPRAAWFDSVVIARRAWPELKGNGGHGLASLKTHLGISLRHHDAGEDAKAAALVVLHAEHDTGQTYEDLAAKVAKNNQAYRKAIVMNGKEGGPLFGQVACFTGALTLSRAEATTLAAAAGISVKASVSRKVTLLIVGDQDLALLAGQTKSTKHRRAEELIAAGHDIRVLGETEFLELLKAPT